jgi:hypothetical protein
MLRTIGRISVVRHQFPEEMAASPSSADHPRGKMELVNTKVLDGRLVVLEYRPAPSKGTDAH